MKGVPWLNASAMTNKLKKKSSRAEFRTEVNFMEQERISLTPLM
jgi:hypothetical protein